MYNLISSMTQHVPRHWLSYAVFIIVIYDYCYRSKRILFGVRETSDCLVVCSIFKYTNNNSDWSLRRHWFSRTLMAMTLYCGLRDVVISVYLCNNALFFLNWSIWNCISYMSCLFRICMTTMGTFQGSLQLNCITYMLILLYLTSPYILVQSFLMRYY
jgi:hypothetical protein